VGATAECGALGDSMGALVGWNEGVVAFLAMGNTAGALVEGIGADDTFVGTTAFPMDGP
jgi:hypothetical protein